MQFPSAIPIGVLLRIFRFEEKKGMIYRDVSFISRSRLQLLGL